MVAPVHGVAVGVAAVLAVAIWSEGVPLTRLTVLAVAPWPVAAGAVVVAGRAGAYDDLAVSVPVLVAALGGVAVAAWVLFARLAALRDLPYRERYLAVGGLGAAVVVLPALVGHVEDPSWVRVAWVAIAPVVAGVVAAVGYFLLGLVYTDALVAFRLAGLYVVGAVVLDGVASATVVEEIGRAHV